MFKFLFIVCLLVLLVNCTEIQNVNTVITLRTGGQWVENGISHYMYDIVTTNTGKYPITNLTITITNGFNIKESWNLMKRMEGERERERERERIDNPIYYYIPPAHKINNNNNSETDSDNNSNDNSNSNNDNSNSNNNNNNYNILKPGKSIFSAGFVVFGDSVPIVGDSFGFIVSDYVESHTPCSKVGFVFDLVLDKTIWDNGTIYTYYYLSFINSGTSIITHAAVDIFTTNKTEIDESSLFGLILDDDLDGYNVSIKYELFPGKTLLKSAGFVLVGPGYAFVACDNAEIYEGVTVNHDNEVVVLVAIASFIGILLILATITIIIIYRKKNVGNKSPEIMGSPSYKYHKLESVL